MNGSNSNNNSKPQEVIAVKEKIAAAKKKKKSTPAVTNIKKNAQKKKLNNSQNILNSSNNSNTLANNLALTVNQEKKYNSKIQNNAESLGSDEDYSDDEDEGEDGYKPGGYHPVSIGDRFNFFRYTVIEKLGWGHFSTVWLCYDKKKSSPEKPEYVALKVQKSATHYREAALDEIELLSSISKQSNSSDCISTTTNNNIVELIDHFDHTGPNGKHVCMAFELLGENLLSVIKKYEYRGIPIPIVKRFVFQICEALAFLHSSKCNIIHTDLKPENLLFESNHP